MQFKEDPEWRASALKKILTSGVGLCASVGFVALLMAILFDSPLWHLWVVLFFAAVLLVAQHFASKYLKTAITLLILIIYAAAVFIKVLVDVPLLSDIGLIFLYTSPFLALVLLNQRVSSLLMYVNTVPFLLVTIQFLSGVYIQTETPDLSYVYLHLLLFVFFNFILPFALMQMIQEAKQTGVVRLEAQKSALARKRIYETLFKLSRQPSLIVRSTDGSLLDVNESLTQLLTQADIIMLRFLIVSKKWRLTKPMKPVLVGESF